MIRAAVDRALDGGINLGAHNLLEARFARAVCDRFALERVRFTNSGTEANLMAISLARVFTRRPKVMVIDGGYHGAVFTFAGGGTPINAPFEFVLAPYNDIDATRGADRAARGRAGGGDPGADDGRRRLHPGRARVSGRAARRRPSGSARC